MSNEALNFNVAYDTPATDSSLGIGAGRFGTFLDGFAKTVNDLAGLATGFGQTVEGVSDQVAKTKDTIRNFGDNRDGATVVTGSEVNKPMITQNMVLSLLLIALLVYLMSKKG